MFVLVGGASVFLSFILTEKYFRWLGIEPRMAPMDIEPFDLPKNFVTSQTNFFKRPLKYRQKILIARVELQPRG